MQDHAMQISFHVDQQGQIIVDILLDYKWIGEKNLQINWTTREFATQVNSINVTNKSFELKEQLALSNFKQSYPSIWIR